MQRHLERARDQLKELDPQLTAIAAIASNCGFAILSHFSRRLRDTYGM